MNTSSHNIEQLCPLCGKANQCAVSRGARLENCWCNGAGFSDAVLQKIPQSEKLMRCLCPACAKATGESALAR